MLIIFDLDGTLSPIGKEISQDTINLLKKLESKGHQIAICSGKPTFYLCGLFRQVGLKRPILLGENGAVIQYGIHLPPIKQDILPYSDQAKKSISFIYSKIQEVLPQVWFQPNMVGCTPFLETKEEFNLVNQCLMDHRENLKDVVVYQHADSFDIVPEGIDKGVGVIYLCSCLHLEKEDIIAVGDGINDYSMFAVSNIALGIQIPDSSKVDYNFETIHDALIYLNGRF